MIAMTDQIMVSLAVAVIISLFLTLALLAPSMANAQITSHYGAKIGDSGGNLVGFDLTIYSPISQKTYANTMFLHFKIDWIYGLMFYDNAIQYGLYAYKIDNNPPVNLPSNQKSNSSTDFIIHPSFSSNIDISNLTNGQHQLVIIADMEWNPFGYAAVSVFNQSSSPILFSIQNSTVSPTPIPTSIHLQTQKSTSTSTVPEFSGLMFLPIFLSLLSIVVLIKKGKVSDNL
jgi:hypothetical protein